MFPDLAQLAAQRPNVRLDRAYFTYIGVTVTYHGINNAYVMPAGAVTYGVHFASTTIPGPGPGTYRPFLTLYDSADRIVAESQAPAGGNGGGATARYVWDWSSVTPTGAADTQQTAPFPQLVLEAGSYARIGYTTTISIASTTFEPMYVYVIPLETTVPAEGQAAAPLVPPELVTPAALSAMVAAEASATVGV